MAVGAPLPAGRDCRWCWRWQWAAEALPICLRGRAGAGLTEKAAANPQAFEVDSIPLQPAVVDDLFLHFKPLSRGQQVLTTHIENNGHVFDRTRTFGDGQAPDRRPRKLLDAEDAGGFLHGDILEGDLREERRERAGLIRVSHRQGGHLAADRPAEAGEAHVARIPPRAASST